MAIEEAQFFDGGIVETCRDLADAGYEVVATGLDMDFRGEPFGPMPRLMAEADDVVKLRAIGARCGRDASRSQRLIDGRPAPVSAPIILVGAEESYQARCRHCHEVPRGHLPVRTPRVVADHDLRRYPGIMPAEVHRTPDLILHRVERVWIPLEALRARPVLR